MTRLLPIDPVLFGEPLPAMHPWAARQGYGGWEHMGTIRAHLLDQTSRCTRCHRGVGSCGMRVTTDWRRTTCAKCLRRVIVDGGAGQGVLDAVLSITEISLRSEHARVWRALSWWRMCGATATKPPSYIAAFFAADVAPAEQMEAAR